MSISIVSMQYSEDNMLFPSPATTDNLDLVASTTGYKLFQHVNLPKGGYWHLHTVWNTPYSLPKGYKYYIISFHLEQIDYHWINQQQLDAPIVVLIDFNNYDNFKFSKNITVLRWTYWHHALEKMIKLFGPRVDKNIKYKYSAFCNRITQSKLIVTAALLETAAPGELLYSLSDWAEEKNVHNWENTGIVLLDKLKDIFKNKYFGQTVSMDNFTDQMNYQHYTANPWHNAYQQAALHFTNESFHYSLMQDGNDKYINAGPHLSEKTFKCLLGGTAFIPVGQFDVYSSLQVLGMNFDYGFDLSFDQDPGNLTRLEKIVHLIIQLQKFTADELYQMTKFSCEHNQDLILSKEFYNNCEAVNYKTLEVLEKIL